MTAGPGARFYRVISPLRELAKHDGFEVTFSSGLQTDRLGQPVGGVHLKDMEGYDVIIGQRFNSHAGLQVWRRARTPYSRLVYETDDDVFSVNMENWAAYHLYQREEIRDAVTHCMEVSDLVTVSTPHLAGVMREHSGNVNVAVLPNYVPELALGLERRRRARPCIGWCGGASHGRDMHLAIPAARRFLKRFPAWDFHLVGTDYQDSVKFSRDRVPFSPWTHITDDPAGFYAALDFDIALAPLLESEFAKSKSGIKAVEAMSMGIPVIASDCEAYRDVITDGETGFLVRDDHQWLKRMSELAADEGLREKMGAAAREAAQAWTIEGNWQKWAEAYTTLFPVR